MVFAGRGVTSARNYAVLTMFLTLGLVTACAATDVPRAGSSNSAGTGMTTQPTQTASYVETQPTAEVDYADVSARFIPLANAQPTLQGSAAAFSAISSDVSVLAKDNLAGTITAGLYSYYNSVYGAIQSDGSVVLKYQGTPAWVFTVPLTHYEDMSQGGLSTMSLSPVSRTGCGWIYVVDATTAVPITWWEHCLTS
jgi:hypothetical protein